MNLREFGNAVFVLSLKNIDLFVVGESDSFLNVEILGKLKSIPKRKISQLSSWKNSLQTFYIHILNDKMIIDTTKSFEFGIIQESDLIEFYKEKGWITPKERDTMFSNYKITSVKFGEISDVALETAVEKIAHELEGVEIKTKGEKTYMVKNGKAIELKGEEFIALVQKYVVGKTVSGLRRNKEMFTLIQNLGIISEVTLQCQADDLSTIFG